MEDLYQELKLHTTKELDLIAKTLGITAHIFKDGFLVHYINSLIVSSEVLNARNSFDVHKKYIKETIIQYIIDLEKITKPIGNLKMRNHILRGELQ